MKVLTERQVKRHKRKMSKDKSYRASVNQFYAVLLDKTGHGTASAIVSKYDETEDGCLAWKDLFEEKEYGGDKTTRQKILTKNLLNAHFAQSTNGGLNKYINDFEKRVFELERLTGRPMDDLYKIEIFTDGIKDDRYNTVLTLSALHDWNYSKLKQKLMALGTKMKIIDGPDNRRNQNRKTRRVRNRKQTPKNPNKTDPPKGEDDDPPEGSTIAKDSWKKMSKKNKQWYKHNKDQDKQEYGGQYSGDKSKQKSRKQQLKSTVDDDDDDDDKSTTKVQFEDPPSDTESDKKPDAQPQSIFRNKKTKRAVKMFRRLGHHDPLEFVPEAPLEGYERRFTGYR